MSRICAICTLSRTPRDRLPRLQEDGIRRTRRYNRLDRQTTALSLKAAEEEGIIHMGITITKSFAATLGVAIASMLLTGCSMPWATFDIEQNGNETLVSYDGRIRKPPTGNPDSTTWKTLGDAFAAAEADPSCGYDEHAYVAVVPAGGRNVYVAARMTTEAYGATDKIQFTDADAIDGIETALSGLEITKVEDITDKVVPQADLEKLVGKSGKDLMSDGYRFVSYSSYGGDSTTATFDKGYYGYEITFSKKLTEGANLDGDEGAAVRDATITGVRSDKNLSLAALDPTKAGKVEEQDSAPEPFVSAIAAPPGSVADPSAIPHTEPETETK